MAEFFVSVEIRKIERHAGRLARVPFCFEVVCGCEGYIAKGYCGIISLVHLRRGFYEKTASFVYTVSY